MITFESENFASPENFVLLSDGAFDQARGEGIAEVLLDLAVIKEAADSLNVRPSHLPTLAVVALATDGSCKTEKYRSKYQETDQPTFVAGASVGEDTPSVLSRIGRFAREVDCQSLSFITVGSLLDTSDHYTALLKGFATMQHAETLKLQENRSYVGERIMPSRVQVDPIYRRQGAFMQHAEMVIRASEAAEADNPSPFVIRYP